MTLWQQGQQALRGTTCYECRADSSSHLVGVCHVYKPVMMVNDLGRVRGQMQAVAN